MTKFLKTILLFILLINTFIFSFSGKVQAQTVSSKYIWEYLKPGGTISDASDLKTKLESEVLKVVAAGHLSPFRALYGEGRDAGAQFYWYHSYDTIYTLSLAYPYLTTGTQNSVKTYMQTEMQNYPLWSDNFLSTTTGTKRQPDILSTADLETTLPGYSSRPKIFALYSLWLYAQNTGDWSYIQNNWLNITAFYGRNSGEVAKYYTSIAGAVGLARMAYQKSPQDIATVNSVSTTINTGLTNGKSFYTPPTTTNTSDYGTGFGPQTEQAYKFNSGENWDTYSRRFTYTGFQFMDISPEIGRYFIDDATLKSAVLGTKIIDTYSLSRGEYFYPLWYMAQGPADTVYFGEGSGTPPDTKSMIFPIKNWVQKLPVTQLRKYLDVPDALIGDYYYMQNMTRTIESSSLECWQNIQTNTQNCLTGTTQTPTITIATTTMNPCPLKNTGDADCDRKISMADFELWRKESTGSLITKVSDFNSDGAININDYNIWKLNFK